MTNLIRRDPYFDLRTTMERMLEGGVSRPWHLLPNEQETDFPVDLAETNKEITVKAALPGVKPEDVQISVQNNVLTIRAEHKEESEEKKEGYYRRELRYGSFQRAFVIPSGVDVEKANATFENGILHLILPKAEVAQAKQIKVNS
jgi:HSP20 family protein